MDIDLKKLNEFFCFEKLVGRARTGAGKTLAFSLPIIERLLAVNQKDF